MDTEIEALQVAAAYATIRPRLRRAAGIHLFFGAIAIAAGSIHLRSIPGLVNVILGTVMVITAAYLLVSRSPRTLLANATCVGMLGITNLVFFLLGVSGRAHVAGNPIYAVLMLFAAWSDYRFYPLYRSWQANVQPGALATFSTWYHTLLNCRPAVTPDCVEFRNDAFTNDHPLVRVRCVGNLGMCVTTDEGIFGMHRTPAVAFWFRPREMKVEHTGEGWLGNKLKAKVTIGEVTFTKVKISREMLERIALLAGGVGLPISAPSTVNRP